MKGTIFSNFNAKYKRTNRYYPFKSSYYAVTNKATEIAETNSTYKRTLLRLSYYDANGGSVSKGSPIHIGN